MNLTVPQIKRITTLSQAGLSDAAVAVVMNVDLGLDLNGDKVKYYRYRYGAGSRRTRKGVAGVVKDPSANCASFRARHRKRALA